MNPESNLVHLPASANLLTVERARDLLAEARSVDEVRDVADKADAFSLYLRKHKASIDAQNDAVEIGIWARRRMGELLAEMPRQAGPGRGKKGKPTVPGFLDKLDELGITPKAAAICQALASKPTETIAAHVASARGRAEKLSVAGAIAAVSHAADYKSDEWYTPDEIVNAVRGLFGGEIDLDPASNEDAQARVRAKRWYGPGRDKQEERDGLSKPWRGDVFVNPPYAQPACAQFCDKFREESKGVGGKLPHMTRGVLLVNASTDTSWWHRLAGEFLFAFSKGRTAFVGPDGKPVKGNRVGQVVFFHGFAQPRMIKEFFGESDWTLCGTH